MVYENHTTQNGSDQPANGVQQYRKYGKLLSIWKGAIEPTYTFLVSIFVNYAYCMEDLLLWSAVVSAAKDPLPTKSQQVQAGLAQIVHSTYSVRRAVKSSGLLTKLASSLTIIVADKSL